MNFESKIVNKNFVSANYNSSIKQITTTLDKEINGKKIKCLPLLDDMGRIIDFATNERIKSFPLSNLKINDEAINNVLEALSTGCLSSKGIYFKI